MFPPAIRVLIVDDHTIVRRGIRALLSFETDIDVIGEASDGAEAVALTQALQPDLILMDLMMPRMNGIEAIIRISVNQPRVRILILTSSAPADVLFPAIQAGAFGYLLKDATPTDLAQTIRQAARGEATLDMSIAIRALNDFLNAMNYTPKLEPLTRREMDILRLLAEGLRNKEIADLLAISERTVRAHIGHILEKLHLTNRTQVVMYALGEGLMPLDHSSQSS